jgi:hypothetical protein
MSREGRGQREKGACGTSYSVLCKTKRNEKKRITYFKNKGRKWEQEVKKNPD